MGVNKHRKHTLTSVLSPQGRGSKSKGHKPLCVNENCPTIHPRSVRRGILAVFVKVANTYHEPVLLDLRQQFFQPSAVFNVVPVADVRFRFAVFFVVNHGHMRFYGQEAVVAGGCQVG